MKNTKGISCALKDCKILLSRMKIATTEELDPQFQEAQKYFDHFAQSLIVSLFT